MVKENLYRRSIARSEIKLHTKKRREEFESVYAADLGLFLRREKPRLIRDCNGKISGQSMKLPSVIAIITDGKYGHVDENGIFVIPVDVLKK